MGARDTRLSEDFAGGRDASGSRIDSHRRRRRGVQHPHRVQAVEQLLRPGADRDRRADYPVGPGTRIRATPVPQFAVVPTAQMLAGDWSTFPSPSCNGGRQLSLKAPFANNQISPSAYSPVAVAIMNSGHVERCLMFFISRMSYLLCGLRHPINCNRLANGRIPPFFYDLHEDPSWRDCSLEGKFDTAMQRTTFDN